MRPGDFIFLSASVPSRPGWTSGARPSEIEEAVISLARAVFARRGRLLFGGHPSISPLVSSVAAEYHAPDPQRPERPVVTFQSELFRGALPDETWLMSRMGWSDIVWTPIVPDPKTPDRAASLRRMRQAMFLDPEATPDLAALVETHRLKPPRAMIAIGGMDGVRDEALMFLAYAGRRRGPAPRVFAIGSGGGAAARLLAPLPELSARLWPDGVPAADDLEALRVAREEARLIGLEDHWRAEMGVVVDGPFQPYAAMTQWLMDSL